MSQDELPVVADPSYVKLVVPIVRLALQFLMGAGFLTAAWSDSQIGMAATLLVVIGTGAWSLYEKLQAEKRKRDSAAASAHASAEVGKPVVVITK